MIEKFIELYKQGKVPMSSMLKAAAFKEELEKNAAPDVNAFLKYLAGALGVTLLTGATAAGTDLAVAKYQQHKIEQSKDPLFREILSLRPELKQNQTRAKLYFDALMHFSPAIAANPLAASTYIAQALEYDGSIGGPTPDVLNTLTGIQKSVDDSRKNRSVGALSTMFSGIHNLPTTISSQPAMEHLFPKHHNPI
jgi:hypothetical protein